MFVNFKKAIQDRLDFLTQKSTALYEVELDRDAFWNAYLDAYPEGTNEIYRERRQYDCACCRQFIRNYGLIVGIVDGKKESIWDVVVEEPYATVASFLKEIVGDAPIKDVFFSKFAKLGTDYNFELDGDTNIQWNHFYYQLPASLVDKSNYSIESKQSKVRQLKEVIQRSFDELTPSAVDIVLELINDKLLYRGEEHKDTLSTFKVLQKDYITAKDKDAYCWFIASKNGRIAAIRNTAIGTLLINLSEGMEIELAVKKFESVVAPQNYKRPTAIFTSSMKKNAEKKVEELGLMNSLGRRYANLKDINVQDVLWASGDSAKIMKSPFDLLEGKEKISSKNFNHLKEVGIEYFTKEILPTAKSLELLVDNKHRNNFMSIIAPKDLSAPSLLKWDNGFSWSYAGNFTDSIKESVKRQGGKVDGFMRFSLSWTEGNTDDNSDLDAHCHTPVSQIYFGDKKCPTTRGELDVDIIYPKDKQHKDIVENITFPSKIYLRKGIYRFVVHNYSLRGTQKGFVAELELGGNVHTYVYDAPLRDNRFVDVVTVNYDGKTFKVKSKIPSTHASKEVWGVSTMKFIPVTTVMHSPNHWGNNAVGNKHYFFTLEGCKNTDATRGFYNEYLRGDLQEHRKVFEALGQQMKVEHSDNQLSGIGFSSTMENEIIVKVNNQPIKIKITDEQCILNSSTKKVSI